MGTMTYSYVSIGFATIRRAVASPRLRKASRKRRQVAAKVGKKRRNTSVPRMIFLGQRMRASAALMRPGGVMKRTHTAPITENTLHI